jgi:membrane-associated phospholipid phosphatase
MIVAIPLIPTITLIPLIPTIPAIPAPVMIMVAAARPTITVVSVTVVITAISTIPLTAAIPTIMVITAAPRIMAIPVVAAGLAGRCGADRLLVATEGVGSVAMIERRASQASRSWCIVPGALLCVFGLLTWQVVSHGPLTRFDVHARNAIQRAANSSGLHWLGPIGRGCADLGDQAPAILGLLVTTGLAAWYARSWRPVLLAVGAGVVLATVIPLKIWVARPGPGNAVLGNADLGFFPSGHTADAVCCYVTGAFLLGTFAWTSRTARRLLSGLVVGLLVLTIFGLLWSNYHWVTDILGSLCWCGAWLLVLRRFGLGDAGTHHARADRARADRTRIDHAKA